MPRFTSVSLAWSTLSFHHSSPVQAHLAATLLHGCSIGNSDLQCRLDSLLHSLYVLAAVLGLLLLLVVAAALYVFHKHKSEGSLID